MKWPEYTRLTWGNAINYYYIYPQDNVQKYRAWIIDRYATAMSYYINDELESALKIAEELLNKCCYPFDYYAYGGNEAEIANFEAIKFGDYTITLDRVQNFIKMIPKRQREIEIEQLEFKRKKEEIELTKQKWEKELRMNSITPKDDAQAVALQIERLRMEAERLHSENIQKQLFIKEKTLEIEKQEEKITNLSIEKLKLQKEYENSLVAIRTQLIEIKKQERTIDIDTVGDLKKIENEQKLFNLRTDKEKELFEIHKADYQLQLELRKLEIEKLRLALELEKIQNENKKMEIERLQLQAALGKKNRFFSWFKKR